MTAKRALFIRLVLSVAALLLAAYFVRLALEFRQFHRVEAGFSAVELGQSRSSIDNRFGRPNYYEGKCGVIHVPSRECATEYVYSHPAAPLLPDYFIVAFDSNDRVIEANRWSSP